MSSAKMYHDDQSFDDEVGRSLLPTAISSGIDLDDMEECGDFESDSSTSTHNNLVRRRTSDKLVVLTKSILKPKMKK